MNIIFAGHAQAESRIIADPMGVNFHYNFSDKIPVISQVAIHSSGSDALIITGVELSNPASFAIVEDTCSGSTISAPGTCVISIKYEAAGISNDTGALSIHSNALDGVITVALNGRASLWPVSLKAFGGNMPYSTALNSPSLSLDASDTPHYAYSDYMIPAHCGWDIFYDDVKASYVHNGLSFEAVCSDEPVNVYLDFDMLQRPHLKVDYHSMDYSDPNNFFPVTDYLYYDGSSWQVEDSEALGSPHRADNSVVYDSQGREHRCYFENGELKYAYYDGASWQALAIDKTAASSCSIAVDSHDRPHIIYLSPELYVEYSSTPYFNYAWLAYAFLYTTPVPVCDSADILCVPLEYTTIQSAINAAVTGDSIYIAQGTYYEHISITKGGTFTIEGGWDFTTNTHSTDASLTKIDGSLTGRVFYINPQIQNSPITLTIKDLTVQNGKRTTNDGQPGNNYGGGLYADNFTRANKITLTLQNNKFTGNTVTGGYSDGGAMAIVANYKDVDATLTGNEIYGNHADYDSGGMLFRTYGSNKILNVVMSGNNIHDNTSRFGAGMFFYNDGTNSIMNLNLTNNTISNNSVTGCFIQADDLGGPAYGGGIGFITNGNATTNLTLTGNNISGNSAVAGAGIYFGNEHYLQPGALRYTAKVILNSQNNNILNNTIPATCASYANVSNGGGVTIQSDPDLTQVSTFTFNNDTIVGNSLYDLNLETDNRNLVNITAVSSNIGAMRRYGSRDYDAVLCPNNGWWKRPCILTDMGELSLTCTDADSDGYYAEGLDCGTQDCNDTNALINPGAAEVCDGVDNDCDGVIDEGFDADNDGYTTCNADCNDSNPSVNPGAVEIPNNGIDDDCNPLTPVLSVSGNAYNYPIPFFRATLSANVNASSLGTSYVRYYYTRARMNFASTSVTGIAVSNGIATVTGAGTVNGTAGYTFTATITNGSPDSIAIEIRRTADNTVYYSSGSKAVTSGDYSLTGQ